MTRPKGSKNKPKTAEPVPFDYESNGGDDTYSNMMTGGALNTPNATTEAETWTMVEQPNPISVMPTGMMPFNPDRAQQLFLIEGNVRLIVAGNPNPIFSEQKRLVWAYTFEEAVQKFQTYFAELSTPTQEYRVLGAGGASAIQ